MKSAGEVPGSTPGASGGLASPPPAIWTPMNYSNIYSGSSGMNFNVGINLDSKEALPLLQRQQTWNGVGMSIAGAGTALEGLYGFLLGRQQLDNMKEYYKAETTIRGYDKDVAIRAMDSQDKMTEAQLKAYQSAQTHEQAMGRIQKETQIAITRIQERGKTQRAEILSSSQAFSVGDPLGRDARFYGYGMS
ncbi:MAG: hypothetical protein HY465_01310 [Deltaproteobacteria bacterium]|nr:hypothetical protein [Deltaproteobacteria bacterium]